MSDRSNSTDHEPEDAEKIATSIIECGEGAHSIGLWAKDGTIYVADCGWHDQQPIGEPHFVINPDGSVYDGSKADE